MKKKKEIATKRPRLWPSTMDILSGWADKRDTSIARVVDDLVQAAKTHGH